MIRSFEGYVALIKNSSGEEFPFFSRFFVNEKDADDFCLESVSPTFNPKPKKATLTWEV